MDLPVWEVQPGDVVVGPNLDPAHNTVRAVDGFSGCWIIDFTDGTSTAPLPNGLVCVERPQ